MKPLNQTSIVSSRNYWDFLFVLVAGLLPLTWFSQGNILNSVDLRFPYDVEQWKTLLYVWNHPFNTGAENILDNCLLPFMGMSALLQSIGFSLIATQKVMFVFWYMLPGFAMAYLLRTIFTGKSSTLFRICGISIYMFNLWLEHTWIGFKPPILSAYAFLPFMLGLIIQTLRGELRLSLGLSLFVLSAFLSSGIGNNSSEFGASIAPFILIFVYLFVSGKAKKNFGLFKHLLGRASLFAGAWLLGSLYWFLPQAAAIWRTAVLKMGAQMPSMWEITNWLKGLSMNSSFFNVIRMQADWTWYQGCVDPYRTYSTFYHNSPLFFVLSLILPLIVFIGLFNKQIRYKGFFLTLLIGGIILSMGAHPPTGSLYLWMSQHIPLFWIFRSPYLKFFIWVLLAYGVFFGAGCVLISRGITSLLSRFKGVPIRSSFIAFLVGILFCSYNLVYAFPITLGKFFTKAEERTFLPPEHISIPNYADHAGTWLDSQKGFFRFFSLPGDNPSIYKWGGVHFGSILRERSTKALVFPYDPQWTLVSQGATNQSRDLLKLIRNQIYEESTLNAADLLVLLNVKYILQEKDIRYDFYKGLNFVEGDDPEFVATKISKQKGLTQSKSFGEWTFHKLDSEIPRIYATQNASLIHGPLDLFTWLTYTPFPTLPAFFFNPTSEFAQAFESAPVVSSLPNKEGFYTFPDSFGAKLVVPTNQLKSTIDLSNKVNQQLNKTFKVDLNYTEFNKPEFRDGATWMWWAGNLDDIKLNNSSNETKKISFFVKVNSIEIDREFYVSIGIKLLDHPKITHDQDTELYYKEFEVPPGEHTITFYSPTRNTWRHGKGMSFSIEKESLAFGMLTFEFPFQLSQTDNYQIKIYPKENKPLSKSSKEIILDGKAINFKTIKSDRKNYYQAFVQLDSGKHQLTLDQENGENYFIELSKEEIITAATSFPTLLIESTSPTKQVIEVKAEAPFFLVFNESFHPLWQASTKEKGKKQIFATHSKVNGYANGYFIDKIGQYKITLEFTPQKLFNVCMIITLMGLLLALTTVLIHFKKR